MGPTCAHFDVTLGCPVNNGVLEHGLLEIHARGLLPLQGGDGFDVLLGGLRLDHVLGGTTPAREADEKAELSVVALTWLWDK